MTTTESLDAREPSPAANALAAVNRIGANALLPAGAFLAIALLGWFNGGYFAPAWGWATLAFVWVILLALAARSEVSFSVAEGIWLAALLALSLWTLASLVWSADLSRSALEVERTLVYVSGAAAAVLVVRRATVTLLLAGLLAGLSALSVYALLIRLFPERLGVFDPIAGYRLSEPIGYWNALGISSAMGVALALAFAARGKHIVSRALAAAAVPLLLTTVYFTFGRGPWFALAAGVLVAAALAPRRLQLAAAALATLVPGFAAVLLASRSDALTHSDALLEQAADEGRSLLVALVLLAAASAATVTALAFAERRLTVPLRLQRAFAVAMLLVLAVGVAAVFARYGSPPTLVRKSVDAFEARPIDTGGNLEQRLFSFSGSGRPELWRAAWRGYEQESALLGTGAGTYEQLWNLHRPIVGQARDAHNLYIEVLAELGLIGLALLVVVLAAPLAVVRRARGHPLFPGAIAAYVAFLVHASVDWDWEIPVVTLAALFCGAALLVSARGDDVRRLAMDMRFAVGSSAVALGIVALVGLVGNSALAASEASAREENSREAVEQAKKAQSWAPWSSAPWRALGEAELGRGNRSAAARSFRSAVSSSPNDWSLWFQLALATGGAEQRRALARAKALNPLSSQVAEFEQALAEK